MNEEVIDKDSSSLRYAGNSLMIDVQGVDPKVYERSKVELSKIENNYLNRIKELQGTENKLEISTENEVVFLVKLFSTKKFKNFFV